jgi:hypothetical protein
MKGATRGQHVAVRSVRMARFCARLFVVLALAGVSVSAQRGPIRQQLAFTPYHASGTYDVGETVGWTVTPGSTAPTYKYRWTIRRNNAVGLKEGTLDLTSGKATIEILGDQPGMIYVAIEAFEDLTPASAAPVGDGPRFVGGNTGRNTGLYAVGAAVAPTKIGLSTPRPADFDAFWDAKRAADDRIRARQPHARQGTGLSGARTNEILEVILHGGTFMPTVLSR